MTKVRLRDDGRVVEILADSSERRLEPRADWPRLDATTEEEIAAQAAEDDAEAVRDAAAYARRVRQRSACRRRRSLCASACRSTPCAIGSRASVCPAAPPAPCFGSSTAPRSSP